MSDYAYEFQISKIYNISHELRRAGFSMNHSIDYHEGVDRIVITFPAGLTLEQVKKLDQFIATFDGPLVYAQQSAYTRIDSGVPVSLMKGFTYDGVQFSLSDHAQLNWSRLAVSQQLGTCSFPRTVATLQNGTYSIKDEAALLGFLRACDLAIEAVLLDTRSLKGQIRQATTIAEVNAAATAADRVV